MIIAALAYRDGRQWSVAESRSFLLGTPVSWSRSVSRRPVSVSRPRRGHCVRSLSHSRTRTYSSASRCGWDFA